MSIGEEIRVLETPLSPGLSVAALQMKELQAKRQEPSEPEPERTGKERSFERIRRSVKALLREERRGSDSFIPVPQGFAVDEARAAEMDRITKRILTPSMAEVLRAVSEQTSISIDVLRGPRGNKTVCRARQVAMYLMDRHCRKSTPRIGAFLGGRDHSTVIHGRNKVEEDLPFDAELRALVGLIEDSLR